MARSDEVNLVEDTPAILPLHREAESDNTSQSLYERLEGSLFLNCTACAILCQLI